MSPRDELQAAIPPDRSDRAKPSTTKLRSLDEVVGRLLGIDPAQVYSSVISKPGNVSVRLEQSERSKGAKVATLVVEGGLGPDLERSTASATRFVGPGRNRAVLLVSESDAGANDWEVRSVVEHENGPTFATVSAHWNSASRLDPALPKRAGLIAASVVPLTVDAGTARMARLAIASSPAVLFVGPPGTGKNRLLNEILALIKDDP